LEASATHGEADTEQSLTVARPPGYPSRRLLIIVYWSVNWFVLRPSNQIICLPVPVSVQQLHSRTY